jgi:hypothetical protein
VPLLWGDKPQVEWARHRQVLEHIQVDWLIPNVFHDLLRLNIANKKGDRVLILILLLIIFRDHQILLTDLLAISENIEPGPPSWLIKQLFL